MPEKSELALLSLYVYRQMDKIDWLPFIKAAIERNPVCFTDLNGKTTSEVYNILQTCRMNQFMMGKGWHYLMRYGISGVVTESKKLFYLLTFLIHKDKAFFFFYY